MKLPIYRAIPRTPDLAEIIKPKTTWRLPGNVPYLIDNLWEWLRPADRPCRRISVFASPTPALAVSATGGGTVYRVEFVGQFRAVQLITDADARTHKDIKGLTKLVTKKLGTDWGTQSAYIKLLSGGGLFLPCLSKEEVTSALKSIPESDTLLRQIREASTFWSDTVIITAETDELPSQDGEMFFEPGDGYRLLPL